MPSFYVTEMYSLAFGFPLWYYNHHIQGHNIGQVMLHLHCYCSFLIYPSHMERTLQCLGRCYKQHLQDSKMLVQAGNQAILPSTGGCCRDLDSNHKKMEVWKSGGRCVIPYSDVWNKYDSFIHSIYFYWYGSG
jgi:hypothetical protein